MDDETWQMLYDTIAHGDLEHKAWLRGMFEGAASIIEKRHVLIKQLPKGA